MLFRSIENGDVEMTKFLIKKGIDYNKRNNEGQNAFVKCIENGNSKMLEYLINTPIEYDACMGLN